MPTDHPRHAITETDDIRDALEIARRAWPDLADRPGALLRALSLPAGTPSRMITLRPISNDSKRSKKPVVHWAVSSALAISKELRKDWPE